MARPNDSNRLIHNRNANDTVGTSSPYTITSSYTYDTHHNRFDRGKLMGTDRVGNKYDKFKGWIPPIQEYDSTNTNHLKHTHVVTYRISMVEGYKDNKDGTFKAYAQWANPYYKIGNDRTQLNDKFNLQETLRIIKNKNTESMTRGQYATYFMDYIDNNINNLNLGIKFCGARYNRVKVSSTYYVCKKAHIARNGNKPGTSGTSTYQWRTNAKPPSPTPDVPAELVTEYWDASSTYWDSYTTLALASAVTGVPETEAMYETWQWGKAYFPNRKVVSYEPGATTRAINFDIDWDTGWYNYEQAENWLETIKENGNYFTQTSQPSISGVSGISDPTKHFYITHVQPNNIGSWYVVFRIGAIKVGDIGAFSLGSSLNINLKNAIVNSDFDLTTKQYFEEEFFHDLQLGHNNDLNYSSGIDYADDNKDNTFYYSDTPNNFGKIGYTKDENKTGYYAYKFENKNAPYNTGVMAKYKKKINEDRIITLDTLHNRFTILSTLYTNVVKICGIVQNPTTHSTLQGHYFNGDPLIYEPKYYRNGSPVSWGYNSSNMRAFLVGSGIYRALLAYCEVDRTGYFEFVIRVPNTKGLKGMNLQLFIISKEFSRYMQTKYISETNVSNSFTKPERDLTETWAEPNHTYGHFWYYLSDTFTLKSILDNGTKFRQFYTEEGAANQGQNTTYNDGAAITAYDSTKVIHTDKSKVYGKYWGESGVQYQRVGAFKEVHSIDDLKALTNINLIPDTELY